jgi:hypothetical protein
MATTSEPTVEVLYRHRRRQPTLALGIIGALILGLAAASAEEATLRTGFAIAAALVLIAGVLLHRIWWVEDQIVDAAGVTLEARNGSRQTLPANRISHIERDGRSLRFNRDDGGTLAFLGTGSPTAVLQTLERLAPGIMVIDLTAPG